MLSGRAAEIAWEMLESEEGSSAGS